MTPGFLLNAAIEMVQHSCVPIGRVEVAWMPDVHADKRLVLTMTTTLGNETITTRYCLENYTNSAIPHIPLRASLDRVKAMIAEQRERISILTMPSPQYPPPDTLLQEPG